jgi:hypothetical protein
MPGICNFGLLDPIQCTPSRHLLILQVTFLQWEAAFDCNKVLFSISRKTKKEAILHPWNPFGPVPPFLSIFATRSWFSPHVATLQVGRAISFHGCHGGPEPASRDQRVRNPNRSDLPEPDWGAPPPTSEGSGVFIWQDSNWGWPADGALTPHCRITLTTSRLWARAAQIAAIVGAETALN